jgi:hypothetical protein
MRMTKNEVHVIRFFDTDGGNIHSNIPGNARVASQKYVSYVISASTRKCCDVFQAIKGSVYARSAQSPE